MAIFQYRENILFFDKSHFLSSINPKFYSEIDLRNQSQNTNKSTQPKYRLIE